MDIMIDLETMDTASTAAIVAIGAVVFDAKTGTVEKNSAFYTTVDLQSCIDHGMTVAGRTIEWWLTKSEQARTAIIDKPAHIHTALNEFSQWVIRQTDGKPERAHIWATAPTSTT